MRCPDLPVPELAWTVRVDLDPVVVGVAQVERLADEVVGEAVELHAVSRGVREPAREVGALGHEQREVEETGVAVGGSRAGLLDSTSRSSPPVPSAARPPSRACTRSPISRS